MISKQTIQRYRKAFAVLFMIGVGLFAYGCSSNSSSPVPTGSAPASQAPPQASGSAYENKLVRRPGSSAEDGKVYVVQGGKKRWVVNASWFGGHGFKFPDDVHEISAAELDAIPTGDPIQ